MLVVDFLSNVKKVVSLQKINTAMKKRLILLVLACMLGGVAAQAQRPVGDTIVGADSTYMYYIYDWWRCANHDPDAPQWYTITTSVPFLWTLEHSLQVQECYSGGAPSGIWATDAGNYITGVQMVTDRPVKVLGVAACAFALQSRDTTLSWFRYELYPNCPNPTHLFPNTRDTTLAGRYTDSLLLLKPTAYGPEYLTGGPWRVENAHRYMPLPTRINGLDISDGGRPNMVLDSMPIVPLYEVMFDKPQVVTDSFIVAGTANNNEGSVAIEYAPGSETLWEYMWLWNQRPTRYWGISYFYNPDLVGIQTDIVNARDRNVLWYKYRTAPWMRLTSRMWDQTTSGWGIYLTHPDSYMLYVPVIFPIVDPDFDTVLCDVARDVRLVSATDTTLTLMWNGGNAVQWEVVYAEVNSPTSQTVTTNVPMVTLTGLRERTNYLARVRGMCEGDAEYGEWSDMVDLWTSEHQDDPVSVSNLDRFTQMMPNPARGQVTLLSSYRLSRVVVYDLAGHVVLEQEDDGLATAFDVSGLAKGVYVVAIHTPAGIATKRLVVE